MKKRWMWFSLVVVLGMTALVGCSGIEPPSGVTPIEEVIEVTGYCDCGKCCGWERSWLRLGTPVYTYGANKGKPKEVGITSTGTETRHGTAAVDPKRYPYGTVFYVPGYGYARGEDAGGAIKGAHIDLWFPSHEAALKWGRKKMKVKVWKKGAPTTNTVRTYKTNKRKSTAQQIKIPKKK